MRVISAQSKDVWDILQRDEVYFADIDKVRETHNDYSEDMKNLNGFVPIWCYAWPNMNYYTMYDGKVLDYLRNEMSLDRKNCWDDFYLFEIEINPKDTCMGTCGNISIYTRIFPRLTLDMVMAVYEVRDSDEDNPYYKTLTPIYKASSDIIATKVLNCKEVSEYAENSLDVFEHGEMGRCLECLEDTDCVIDNKHFCSIECMWSYEQKFLTKCKGLNKDAALRFYKRLTDDELKHGIHKVVSWDYPYLRT